MSTLFPSLIWGTISSVPERQRSSDSVLQALTRGQLVLRQLAIAPVLQRDITFSVTWPFRNPSETLLVLAHLADGGVEVVLGVHGWRWGVIGASPDLHLRLAVFGRRLGLVEAPSGHRSGARSDARCDARAATSDRCRPAPATGSWWHASAQTCSRCRTHTPHLQERNSICILCMCTTLQSSGSVRLRASAANEAHLELVAQRWRLNPAWFTWTEPQTQNMETRATGRQQKHITLSRNTEIYNQVCKLDEIVLIFSFVQHDFKWVENFF